MTRCSRSLLLATTALAPLAIHPALANPIGAQVVAGTATVQGQGTAAVTIKEQTNSAIINWREFNIGVNESTTFVQPNAASVILNRVTGNEGPSEILGSLTSNGKVFLVNPDGLLFGPGAKINTGSFLATTNDIANSEFMAGRYNFTIPGKPSASIVNEGSITAQVGGFAALVAPGVRNDGVITATLGTIGLAAGNGFTLDFYGDKLITLGVSDSIASRVIDVATGQPLDSLVKNAGTLKADGGRVELTAAAARQVVDSVINNTGVIEADTIGTHKGMIVLGAATAGAKPADAPAQVVKVSGTLSAAGKKKGTKGGTIIVTGESIKLASATLDASALAGGGKVLVGGDTGGGKPNAAVAGISEAALEAFAVPNATNVSVDAGSTINVSAIDSGNGGKAVVWADGTTSVAGTILARGGVASGDGGFVETSGRQNLGFTGRVDVGAAVGISGTWLLDPKDVTIGVTGPWVVTPQSIESALLNGNVIVTTDQAGTDAGDITVAQSVTWNNGNSLTLNANRNIVVDDGVTISNTDSGDLTLRADSGGTGIGTVSFLGTGKVDFSLSTGLVSIFYNPTDNPANSGINSTSYRSSTNYGPYVITNSAVPNQLTSYMLVNSVYDLQNIENNLAGDYALGTDIDASATINWNSGRGFVPIGLVIGNGFIGTFNGQEYVINNLTINNYGNYGLWGLFGLFGVVGNTGRILNVGLTNADVTGNNRWNISYIGALVGLNEGLISNSYSSGSITGVAGTGWINIGGLVGANSGTVVLSHSTASVTGTSGQYIVAGGLVGWNDGTITQSFATGSVGATANNYSISGGTGGAIVGGLVGESVGSITRSYATGSVSGIANSPPGVTLVGGLVGDIQEGGSVTQSYATGSVTGGNGGGGLVDTGGLVGDLEVGSSVTQSYATGTVNAGAESYTGGLIGLNLYGTITQSYAVGSVGTNPASGGLVGVDYAGSASNSYWDVYASGQLNSAEGTGLTTAQLKSALPTGFDPTVWGISTSINNGYPYLLWQTAAASPPKTTTLTGGPSQIEIVVEADPETKVYGSVDPTLAYQVVSGTLADGVTFSGSLTRDTGENVGTYAIDEGTLSLPSLYALVFEPASFKINPAPLTITANNAIRMAGQPNPSFTASYSGFVLGDKSSVVSDLTFSTPATANSGPGNYAIVPSGATAANYVIGYGEGTLTVVKPPAPFSSPTWSMSASVFAGVQASEPAANDSQATVSAAGCDWLCTMGGWVAPIFGWLEGHQVPEASSEALQQGTVPDPAGLEISLAQITIAASDALHQINKANQFILDQEIQGACGATPGPCSSVNIGDAVSDLQTVSFMGVTNFKSGWAVARMTPAGHQEYVRQFVILRAKQLGYSITN